MKTTNINPSANDTQHTYRFTEQELQHLRATVQSALALLADYMQYEDQDEPSLEQETYEKLCTAKSILYIRKRG